MAAELNFFDTYVLMAIAEEIVPQQTFFQRPLLSHRGARHLRLRQGADRVPQGRPQDGGVRLRPRR